MKFLHITEYSSLIPYKIPECKCNEHSLRHDNSIIRSYIDNSKTIIKESFDTIYNDTIIMEKTIPIKDMIIYDNINIADDEQQIAYVFECPICLYKTITTDKNIDFCPHCENDKFTPQVVALINTSQMKELAFDNYEDTTYIKVVDDNIVFEDRPIIKNENLF